MRKKILGTKHFQKLLSIISMFPATMTTVFSVERTRWVILFYVITRFEVLRKLSVQLERCRKPITLVIGVD